MIGSARSSICAADLPKRKRNEQQCHSTRDNRVKATIVGSLPKPGWLAAPGELFPPWRLEGDRLTEGQEDAVRVWVAAQDRAGLDCITDGEQRRRHYIWGFFQGLDGIDTVNLGKRAQRGQRYHKEIAAARLVGGPDYRGPIFVDALRATLALTDRPVKVTLPGPMTIVDSLVDTIGGRSEAATGDALRRIAEPGGAALCQRPAPRVIQFDEPCFNVYIDKVKDWGIAALERAAEGVTAKKAVHICYGYGTADVKRWKSANHGLEPLRRHAAAAGKVLDRPGLGRNRGERRRCRGHRGTARQGRVARRRRCRQRNGGKRRKPWPSGCMRRCATPIPAIFTPAPIAACCRCRAARRKANCTPSLPARHW